MRQGLQLAAAILLCGLTHGAQALPDPYTDERSRYQAALHALQRGELERFDQLAASLRDYPLHPYLQDRRLRRDLARATDADIAAFLQAQADTSLADRLYRDWLQHLGRTRQWQRFERFYRGDGDAELRCYHLRATRNTASREAWLDAALELWRVGHSQPDACDPVFDVLYDTPRIDTEALWQRIRLAMAEGKLSLAAFLGRKLPDAERDQVEFWHYAHRRPAAALDDARLEQDNAIARRIRVHAIQRLARSQPDTAFEALQARRGQLSDEDYHAALKYVARYAGYRRSDKAYTILAAVPADWRDAEIEELQARMALVERDWAALVDTIAGFRHQDSRFSEWPYWQARALGELGRSEPARHQLRTLSGERFFHGFLAADRLNRPYQLNHRPIEYDESELLALLERHPGLWRAGELHRLGRTWASRREWYHTSLQLDPPELELAAALAHEWGWHDRAIWTAARAGHWDDVQIRFPLAYREQVEQVAAQFDLDPALIFAVIRQESAFMADAHSSAGALGLMQLMPATGRQTALQLRLPRPSRATLLTTSANLRLGSAYLKRMLERYNGHPALAAAAYNAVRIGSIAGCRRTANSRPTTGSTPSPSARPAAMCAACWPSPPSMTCV
ncbi:transglycosylase SLT domain-containing protein [Thiohalobacter thiocyanaticus]|uniref:Lytic murein transglycosylase n=1 Tax=Thiohalobacter thiocyanaticus TaxID=585455 RepID=A0A426QJ07_9GAMM|nr:transglycosylase SLT domain-containing protein [Thiohalobacter thiocyanaticus]RRQ21751.1 lytic murein transglycosylase [Thiohalobacter thiocyanaticus]